MVRELLELLLSTMPPASVTFPLPARVVLPSKNNTLPPDRASTPTLVSVPAKVAELTSALSPCRMTLLKRVPDRVLLPLMVRSAKVPLPDRVLLPRPSMVPPETVPLPT